MRLFHSYSDYSRDRVEQERDRAERSRHSAAQPPRPAGFATSTRPSPPPAVLPHPVRPTGTRQPAATRRPAEARFTVRKPPEPAPAPERAERPASPREKRSRVPLPARGLQIRPQEQQLLLEVGRFRVIAVADLAREIYGGQGAVLAHDLEFLKQKGLVESHFLNLRRDGRSLALGRFEAVTLTPAGQKLLAETGQVPAGQRTYAGLVHPREAEHDAHIFRAFLKEAAEIERQGGRNIRVQLDFELKARINRAMALARKARPGKDPGRLKSEVAQRFGLKLQNDKVVVPDARVEYDLPGGGGGQIDIDVVTSAYRHGPIVAKAQAGFRLYISHGDVGRLGAAIQDDHDLMSAILEI